MIAVKVMPSAWELRRTCSNSIEDDYVIVTKDPIPADQEQLAEQAIAECPRAALTRRD